MKENAPAVIEVPLIGSGSQEEVDSRVQAILDLGTSRGYLTYEELNEKLPDEVVSPDKLDSLLMMIDEMGIKLIDESDVGEFTNAPKARAKKPKRDEEDAEIAPADKRNIAHRIPLNLESCSKMLVRDRED